VATARDGSKNTERLTKSDRKRFYLLRSLLIFVFVVAVPFCQAPDWCLDNAKGKQLGFGAFSCGQVGDEQKIHSADLLTLSPLLTALIDVICMIGFAILTCHEVTWRNQDGWHKIRTGTMVIAMALSCADLVFAVLNPSYPYIANLMRVVILLCFAQNLRGSVMSLFADLKESGAILITIFTYILVFVFTCYYFYRPTFEGITNFGSIRDAYRNLTILFTTANYPDIFLPAQRLNFWNAFLFMFFMLAGLYFLTNLLLANVFNRY